MNAIGGYQDGKVLMTINAPQFIRSLLGLSKNQKLQTQSESPIATAPRTRPAITVIPSDDPLVAYFLHTPGVTDVSRLDMDSPALTQLRQQNYHLVVPLVSQGEVIGLLNLGERRSEQEYSKDDLHLLDMLASQVTPALRVAQLVKQRQKEVVERERMRQELQLGRHIQQTLLPKEAPHLPGWEVAIHYQPAREVGGDFYDFMPLPDGRMVFVVGDVTDKGVPAALVMTTTRAILRGAARRMLSPGQALARSNELILPEIPAQMFITCLYGILDPQTGRIQYANAGHNLPCIRIKQDVTELYATGMPLGLLPGMVYEEKEAILPPDGCMLLYSDGLVEAHNAQYDMFGFPRLRSLVGQLSENPETAICSLMEELNTFTGPDWSQEDDITLVSLHRLGPEG
jgi:serine phosphatase RsbU (regulator of sigma subunit)